MVLRAHSKLWESRQVAWKITCTHGFLSFIMDRTRIPKLYSFQNIGKGKKKSECPYIYFFHPIHNYREYWLFRIYRITVCYTSLQPFSTSPSSLSHEGQFALLPSTPLPTLLTPWENLIWLQWTVVYPLSYQIKMFGI